MAIAMGIERRCVLLLLLVIVNGNKTDPPSEHEAASPPPPPPPPPAQCPDRYLCGGGHDASMTNDDDDDDDDGYPMLFCETANFNCMCDWLCSTYDDCCDGFSPTDPPPPPPPVGPDALGEDVFTCDGLEISFGKDALDDAIFGGSDVHCSHVNRCPKGRSLLDSTIKDKCEYSSSSSSSSSSSFSSSSSSSDIDLRLPVNGRASRVLYRNLYCAICNGEEDVVFWSVQKFLYRGEYIAIRRNISINETSELGVDFSDQMQLRFIYPEGYVPRACRRVIRSCLSSWNGSSATVENCQLRGKPNAFVTPEACEDCTYPAYRNRDCALCNGVDEIEEGCTKRRDCKRSTPPSTLYEFTILVNYNDEDGFASYFAAEDCSTEDEEPSQHQKFSYSFSHREKMIKAQCIGNSCALGGYAKTKRSVGCISNSNGATGATSADGKLLVLIIIAVSYCGIQTTGRLLSSNSLV